MDEFNAGSNNDLNNENSKQAVPSNDAPEIGKTEELQAENAQSEVTSEDVQTGSAQVVVDQFGSEPEQNAANPASAQQQSTPAAQQPGQDARPVYPAAAQQPNYSAQQTNPAANPYAYAPRQQAGYAPQQSNYSAQQPNPTANPYSYTTQQDGSGMNNQNTPRNQNYYTENIRKTKPKKSGIGQLVLIAVLSSLLGGGVVFAAMEFLAPAIQPTLNGVFGTPSSEVAVGNNNGVYKKVEISKSSSPVEAISEKVSPSIVGIKVTVQSQGSGFFFDIGGQDGVGEGSGIIIRSNGYILTNNHVIENALAENSNKITDGSKIEVILPNDKNKSYAAKVIGRDSKTDIAVLKIEAENLPVAELGDSDKVKSGELAVAIGNPGGMDYMGSVTAGIISGINRTIQMENGEELSLIQTDAAINPGNSGGALCNSQGQVVGINTVKIAATGYEGLGFAIPINHANDIAKSLIDYKYVKGRPYLGVSIDQRFDAEAAAQYKVPQGLLVYEVVPLSAAYKAQIRAGDIITKFDGKSVKVFKDLEDQKDTHKPGDKVQIEVYRDGKTITLTVTLGEEKNTD